MPSAPKTSRRGRRPARFKVPAPSQAARQLTAHTYGTILVLTALVVLPANYVESGEAVIIVAGVGISTSVAHLFSDFVGAQLETDHTHNDGHWAGAFPLLRTSLPILTATVVPIAVLVAAALDLMEPTPALRVAEFYCTGRLALTGFFVARYQGRPSTGATWLGGLVLATLGVAVVALKVLLGH